MLLDDKRKKTLENTYQYFLNQEKVLKMKEIPTHVGSNCYIHTFKVTKLVMKRAIKSRKDLDLENLLIACIFHDYYLYNWRTTKDRPHPHGKHHPFIASDNARRDFNISEESQGMIKTHMWPFNFFNPPKSKEARLLCNVDTWVALIEDLIPRNIKNKNEQKYLDKISHLF